ncbi:TetR/AcrR family transcriptional regulator [Nocardia sp. alder85J]|uniref:TetR/AcrR family transcriptional regulator n=1 Tax=Nocardia sp. alder85J TaxID=2862949 RepID=UPI001CD37620|nr:TetR/AcrR family transcriptional regulator [Nocardia sp. alder85J]MCX4095831.1 TetR/AcrR family transcriptional regulator [Nocardia sp. alder85J]
MTEEPVPDRMSPLGQRARQIAAAAAQLFHDVGYQNVSVDQIGAAVGLTGPAVYRHFKSKHQILVHALVEQVAVVEQMADRFAQGTEPATDRLSGFLTELGALVVDRDEAMLWRTEQRHLRPEEQRVFRARFGAVLHRVAGLLTAARPDRNRADAELLGYALLAFFAGTRDIRHGLGTERLTVVQSAIATAIVRCEIPAAADTSGTAPRIGGHIPAGRRERIISTSAALFDRRGFHDVRIDDIAKASNMSVATLYQHVDSKTAALHAILERGAHGLLYVTHAALANAATAEAALALLIRTYIGQALGVHGRIMRILATDLIYLPEQERTALRDAQREYVAEWIEALRAISPGLDAADARALAHAVIGVITDMSQTPRVRTRPGVAGELIALATAMTAPGSTAAPLPAGPPA